MIGKLKRFIFNESLGAKFQAETSRGWLGTARLVGKGLLNKAGGKIFKAKMFESTLTIKLPEPSLTGSTFESILKERRSIDKYTAAPLDLKQLSQLLFAAGGVTGKSGIHALRSYPSEGNTFPIEMYVVINNVTEVPNGIYHYDSINHSLRNMKVGGYGAELGKIFFMRGNFSRIPVVVFMSALFERSFEKFGDRGYRYLYMETGHAGQNLYLQAVSLGLGSTCYREFNDEEANKLLGLDGKSESVLYIHSVGALE